MPDESDALGSLESGLDRPTSSGKGWDQFATNEQLFGLTTDFDEEIYTTRLDRTRADYKSREREAIRIAHEIQNTPFLNSHVGEERQEVADDDDAGMDEEDRYGAVLRPTGAPGKYVPPYLRGKTEASPPVKQRAADSSMAPEPTPRAPAPPAAGVQDDLAAAGSAAMRSNNAKAAAALAKLNIRMTSHSPAAEPTRQPLAKAALPPSAASGGGSPGLAADPAITALSKQPSASTSSKLANLRGLKHRSDVAALNKPMADITEKLNSERERIHLHKQALLKDRMSDLVKFHKSFKLNTPMPEDVAEIIRARKKSPVQSVGLGASSNSGETTSDSGKASSSSNTVPAPPNTCKMASASPEPVVLPEKPTAALSESEGALSILSHEEVAATSDKAAVVTPEAKINPNEAVESVAAAATANATATAITSDSSADLKGPAAEPKQGDKKTSFKFNAKASLFKPSAAASPFVPKLSAPSSRASSSAGVSEFNPFFGRRVLKRAPVSLWGDIFKTTEHRPDSDDAPIWPFGVRTYRSQF
ncbi:poly(A)-binding protein binding protein, partial [Coemansia sp. RSA 2322]